MLKLKHPVGNVFRRIPWMNRTPKLQYWRAFVVVFRDDVNCASGFRFAGGDDCFVDVHSKHAFTAEFWQQRWMHIKNSMGKCPQNFARKQPQVARQTNPTAASLPQGLKQRFAVPFAVRLG